MIEPEVKVAPWEDVVLRLIAIYKFAKAILALLLGLALLKLMHHDLVMILHNYVVEPFHLDSDADSENHFLKWLFEQAAALTPHALMMSSWASFFYATVFAVEGFGLYYKKHWAEYMVLIVTGSFLPFEGYLMYQHSAWWKILLILGNLLIIVYLIHRLRLDARARRAAEARAAEKTLMVDSPAEKEVINEIR